MQIDAKQLLDLISSQTFYEFYTHEFEHYIQNDDNSLGYDSIIACLERMITRFR